MQEVRCRVSCQVWCRLFDGCQRVLTQVHTASPCHISLPPSEHLVRLRLVRLPQVREGRPLPSLAAAGQGSGMVDTAMPQAAALQADQMGAAAALASMQRDAAAAAAGGGNMDVLMGTSPNLQQLNGMHAHGSFTSQQQQQQQMMQGSMAAAAAGLGVAAAAAAQSHCQQQQQQQQQGMAMMRSMDSFTGSVGNGPGMSAGAAAAMQQQQQQGEPAQALPFPEGVKVVPLPVPPAAAAAAAAAGGSMSGMHNSTLSGGNVLGGGSSAVGVPFQGSVPSLQALAVREASVDVSSGAAAAAAAASAGNAAAQTMTLPIAVPARSHASADGGPGGLLQLAGSAGAGPSPLGTSPAMGGPSPGLMVEDHGMMGTSQAMGETAVVSVVAFGS